MKVFARRTLFVWADLEEDLSRHPERDQGTAAGTSASLVLQQHCEGPGKCQVGRAHLHRQRVVLRLLSEEDLFEDSHQQLVNVVLNTGGCLYELGVVAVSEFLPLLGGDMARSLQVNLVPNLRRGSVICQLREVLLECGPVCCSRTGCSGIGGSPRPSWSSRRLLWNREPYRLGVHRWIWCFQPVIDIYQSSQYVNWNLPTSHCWDDLWISTLPPDRPAPPRRSSLRTPHLDREQSQPAELIIFQLELKTFFSVGTIFPQSLW